MFAGKVDWTVPAVDTIQREVRFSSSNDNETEVEFARLYAEILDLSDEHRSESGASNDGLDSFVGAQGLLPSYDSGNFGGLHAATNLG